MLSKVEFNSNPNVIRARECGFTLRYKTLRKALAWWQRLTLVERLEYEADYKFSLPDNVEVSFTMDEMRIYVLYQCYKGVKNV